MLSARRRIRLALARLRHWAHGLDPDTLDAFALDELAVIGAAVLARRPNT